VLSALRGITPRALLELGVDRGTASATLAWIREGRAGSENDRAFARELDPDAIATAVRRCGARLVPWGSPEYPAQLATIPDPPAALYVVGEAPPGPERSVAVVGARRCTDLGRELARGMGRALGLAGATVVSGAARGIDAAAHEGALSAGGRTVAVLGCGIDIAYPPGSRDLLRRIRQRGTVMSEYPPGVPPEQRNFPARNRLVAGLCSATVVVEGADGSGSMITAEHALEFGRDVFAVPGAVTNPLAFVPLKLIREGATMVRGGEDLLGDLGLEPVAEEVADRLDLSGTERELLALLVGPTLPDRLAAELGVGVPEVVGLLMRLELRGLVRGVGGRYEPTVAVQAEARRSLSARGTPAGATSRTGRPARSSTLAAIEER
jgi:DNA processing protein